MKAIYQRYRGWFDVNPARLWPHPPAELSRRYVEAIGGMDRIVELAQVAHDEGDFRWAATVLDHAVFTDEKHSGARELHADTLEQLAYGSENGAWRNLFLSGATELREGTFGTPTVTSSPAMLAQLTPAPLLDAIAISVNGPKAWSLDLAFDVRFTDNAGDANYRLTLRNGVLVYIGRPADDTAAASISLTKMRMLQLLGGDTESPGLDITGDASALRTMMGVLDAGDPDFNIVSPDDSSKPKRTPDQVRLTRMAVSTSRTIRHLYVVRA